MVDKRLSLDDLVAELHSGMTIGIGGWGSRRKPMAAVRAILRSDLTDLTVVSYGGPDVGLLCAAGKVAKVVFGFVTLDSIPTDPHFKAARQGGAIESEEIDEGMFYLGLLAAAQRLPFLPTRAGLGSDVLRVNPTLRTVRSPYDDGEELVAVPALGLDAALIHVNRADARGSGQILGPDPFFDEVFLGAAERRFVTTERLVDTDAFASEGPLQTLCISRLLTDGVVEAEGGAHFTACVPDYGRDEAFQKAYVAAAAEADLWAAFAEPVPRGDRSRLPDGYRLEVPGERRDRSQPTHRAGRAHRSQPGGVLHHRLRRGLPGRRRGHGQRFRDRTGPRGPAGQAHLRPRPGPHRRRRRARWSGRPPLGAKPSTLLLESHMPYRKVFDVVWSGRRNLIMMASQIDRDGNQNISAIGDWAQPKAQLVGVRGAPGNTVNHSTSYWVPNHSTRSFVEHVDVVSGVGYERAAAAGPSASRFHEIRHVVSNLGVFDFETADHVMRLRSVHPGVTVAEVAEATGFDLVMPIRRAGDPHAHPRWSST